MTPEDLSECRLIVPYRHGKHGRQLSAPRIQRKLICATDQNDTDFFVEIATEHHKNAPPRRHLPDEVTPLLFSYMEAPALCRAAAVSRSWAKFAEADAHWDSLCRARWGLAPNSFTPPPDPIKLLYRLHHSSLKTMAVAEPRQSSCHLETHGPGLPASRRMTRGQLHCK
ncbi:unnamed protein product [Phaeothamnion confervicola]